MRQKESRGGSRGTFFAALPDGGGILSEDGSSEFLFFSPAGWHASGGPTFSHLNALRAAVRREAYGLYAQKWAEKALGRPQTPLFCLIGHYEIDTGQPLNFCGASGSFVIGAAVCALRLSAPQR